MQYTTVIVRAFEGEPLKRVVIDATDNRASVALPAMLASIASGESNAISLPRTDLYEFDVAIYEHLLQEWKTERKTNQKTWRRLKHWSDKPAR